jgi:hypothetical protein
MDVIIWGNLACQALKSQHVAYLYGILSCNDKPAQHEWIWRTGRSAALSEALTVSQNLSFGVKLTCDVGQSAVAFLSTTMVRSFLFHELDAIELQETFADARHRGV